MLVFGFLEFGLCRGVGGEWMCVLFDGCESGLEGWKDGSYKFFSSVFYFCGWGLTRSTTGLGAGFLFSVDSNCGAFWWNSRGMWRKWDRRL